MGKSSFNRTLVRNLISAGHSCSRLYQTNKYRMSSGSREPGFRKPHAFAALIAQALLLTSAGIIFGFAITGCTPISSKDSTSLQTQAESAELARRNIAFSEGDAGYDLQLIEKGQFSELEIAFNSDTHETPVISKLENPSRIVLDLEGAVGPKAETIETPESLYVSRVRVGEHPGKSRIVLDISEEQAVNSELITGLPGQYTLRLSQKVEGTSSEQNQMVLNNQNAETLSQSEQAIANSQPNAEIKSDTKTELALNQKIGSEAELTEPALSETGLKETGLSEPAFSEPIAETTLDTDAKARAQPEENVFAAGKKTNVTANENHAAITKENSAEVSGYELLALSPTENTLIVNGKGLANFSLKRTAPSEYVLNLPETKLSTDVEPVLVAPTNSGAIRSVRAKSANNSSEIRIFTDPKSSLQAENSPEGVVISAAANSTADDFSSSRAQASPKLLEGAESVDDEIAALLGDKPKYSGRLISLDLQDTDIDNALRIIAEVSNLNIIASEEVTGKITLRLVDVPWDQALDVILKTNGLDMIQENNVVRIAPVEKLRTERESLKQARQAEEDLEPLSVRYVRISYAKAAELKPLVESVLSERGSVAYDERTNQLIVKDIRKGIVNVAELIAKLDLRTPQVLLETQIVEATTSLARELGSEFGFNYVQSPETGNATGYNFPNTVATGGATSFPVNNASAVTLLLESADGTRSLATRLTALESEGRVKVVSRPAVATTNNKQAMIKSVETIRIRQPDGGLSVATGQGASANGMGAATEEVEVGIVLEVTPQASPDYFVLLDINAKSSTLGSTVVDGIPSEIERSATSSVLVSSGQTFAMGGIYKTSDSNTIEGVPFFKDIPVLGTFFRRSFIDSQDEELLFFITPRIIEGSFDDAAMKAS